MKGLDWGTACGFDLLGKFTGLPSQDGVCTYRDQHMTYGRVACLSSVHGWVVYSLTGICLGVL